MKNEIIKIMNVKWTNRFRTGYYPFSIEELFYNINYSLEFMEALEELINTGFVEEVIIPVHSIDCIEYDYLTTNLNATQEDFKGIRDPATFELLDVNRLILEKFYRLK